jgi:hypothetical protein
VTATDEASVAGIQETTRTWSAAVEDFNGDGWPDLFLNRHQWVARLYINDNGHFSEVDAGSFTGADHHDCKAADVNGDGKPDVFCSAGAARGTRVKSNDLRIQGPDLTFSKVADQAGVMDPFGRGRRIAFLDANGDGYPDLFVGNEEFRPDGIPAPSRLFINDGTGSFHDAPRYGLDLELGSDCAGSYDYNGDGWGDLLVCTTLRGLRLYRNDAGSGFTDVTDTAGLAGLRRADATMADLNGDGALDVVEISPTEVSVLLQQSDGTFAPAYRRSLEAGAWVAVGDANGDAVPDLYVLQGELDGVNADDAMLLNDGGGTSFTQTPIPEASQGSGNVVYPIDHDLNGLMDFIALNGEREENIGPIQLVSFFPASSASTAASLDPSAGDRR